MRGAQARRRIICRPVLGPSPDGCCLHHAVAPFTASAPNPWKPTPQTLTPPDPPGPRLLLNQLFARRSRMGRRAGPLSQASQQEAVANRESHIERNLGAWKPPNLECS
jgi:hypothetical protein